MGEKFSLQALAREQLELARRNRSGRSAKTVVGGHERSLRQTLLTMVADVSLAEHESPGEATLFVLSGRVRLTTSETSWEGITGDMPIIPPISHGLHAVEGSAVMLTVAKHP
ncbi:cupin domain-containing protein [Bounagaea algeriensis]